jgi:hypothetical protein
MTPKDEMNELLNGAISMAIRLLEKHSSHVPFCMAISSTGDRLNIAIDDGGIPGASALIDRLRGHIADSMQAMKYRSVALAQNVDYQSADSGLRVDAIQITLDHENGSPVTCYLPYKIEVGKVIPGKLFAVDPVERFFRRDA